MSRRLIPFVVAARPLVHSPGEAHRSRKPIVYLQANIHAGEVEGMGRDEDDLAYLLKNLPAEIPVTVVGLGSNLIVRDGGVPGVVVRLGKPFSKIEQLDETTLRCGGGASGILVSSTARDHGIAGLEFLRGIPGTVGGFVRMNGGAYGREVQDILVSATLALRSGEVEEWPLEKLGYRYRHSEVPDGAVVFTATFRGMRGDPAKIGAEMDRIAAAREKSQPLRSRTGGSTFKNPPGIYTGENMGIATSSKGNIYIYHRANETRLFEYNPQGTFVREIGRNNYGFSFAHSVRVDRTAKHLLLREALQKLI